MPLPEHILNETCEHGNTRMFCETKECNDYISELVQEDLAEQAAQRASGEDL